MIKSFIGSYGYGAIAPLLNFQGLATAAGVAEAAGSPDVLGGLVSSFWMAIDFPGKS